MNSQQSTINNQQSRDIVDSQHIHGIMNSQHKQSPEILAFNMEEHVQFKERKREDGSTICDLCISKTVAKILLENIQKTRYMELRDRDLPVFGRRVEEAVIISHFERVKHAHECYVQLMEFGASMCCPDTLMSPTAILPSRAALLRE